MAITCTWAWHIGLHKQWFCSGIQQHICASIWRKVHLVALKVKADASSQLALRGQKPPPGLHIISLMDDNQQCPHATGNGLQPAEDRRRLSALTHLQTKLWRQNWSRWGRSVPRSHRIRNWAGCVFMWKRSLLTSLYFTLSLPEWRRSVTQRFFIW